MDTDSTKGLANRPLLADRFQVLAVLGEGASGAVYQVLDRANGGKEVALKILLNDTAFDKNTMERFIEELKVCQAIRHPNIIEAYDQIDLGDTIAFTMEFVRGMDLGKLSREKEIQPLHIEKIFDQFLLALHELHKGGIVHRDLKLENVLLGDNGIVKLSDLGLVKRLEGGGLTRTGILLGTAQYMPPEYVRYATYDVRGDIYAAGLMLYELLTRTRRLSEKSGNEALEHLLKTNFQIPEITLLEVPRKYRAILERALHVEPDNRYQTALELREAILKPFVEEIRTEAHSVVENSKVEGHVTFAHVKAMAGMEAKPRYRPHLFPALCGLALLIGLGLGLAFVRVPSDIPRLGLVPPMGTYIGQLLINDQSKPSRGFQLDISDVGIQLISPWKICPSGKVDSETGMVSCQPGRVWLRIEKKLGDEIEGALIDQAIGDRHLFKANLAFSPTQTAK